MESDVEDDTGCTQPLRIEHAEIVAGIVEEPEIGHELLRVQSPPSPWPDTQHMRRRQRLRVSET